MLELFNYETSWLNPALKIVIALLFFFVAVVYFRSRRYYATELYTVLSVLFWMALIGSLAAFIRYMGHGTILGFTKAFSLKWFQTLGYIIQATLFAFAGWRLAKGIIPELRD
jgi:hypothetical protein